MLSTIGRPRTRSLEEESSPSLSAEIIASSSDLLSEILRNLPVKSLLKFKSVSKHWRSLITDPHFSRRKFHNLKRPSALFLQDPNGPELSFVPLDPSNSHTTAPLTERDFLAHHPLGMQTIQSCNGLFFCQTIDYWCHDDVPMTYYICNPTTKQFKTLPPIYGGAQSNGLRMAIAFDPSESHLYKVICLEDTCLTPWTMQIHIFSPETGSWRLCGAPFEAFPRTDFGSGVYLNGAIHWIRHEGTIWQYFDVKEEVIREMPMPPMLVGPGEFDERAIRYFGETDGHLHLVEDYMFSDTDMGFNVWEMERDRSGWFVKFRVPLHPLEYFNEPFKILCVVRGVKDEDSFLVVYAPLNIISWDTEDNVPPMITAYNLKTKSHRKICDADDTHFIASKFSWNYVFQFIETLSPV